MLRRQPRSTRTGALFPDATLFRSDSGLLFAGDAVGVRLPAAGILRPATPPPDFDLDQAITSLRRFADRSPAGIALAHFGLVPAPQDILVAAEEIITRWAAVAPPDRNRF